MDKATKYEGPHDQHCAWCECEEFAAVQYGTLHHLTLHAVQAFNAAVMGNEEIIEIDEDARA